MVSVVNWMESRVARRWVYKNALKVSWFHKDGETCPLWGAPTPDWNHGLDRRWRCNEPKHHSFLLPDCEYDTTKCFQLLTTWLSSYNRLHSWVRINFFTLHFHFRQQQGKKTKTAAFLTSVDALHGSLAMQQVQVADQRSITLPAYAEMLVYTLPYAIHCLLPLFPLLLPRTFTSQTRFCTWCVCQNTF